MENREDPDAVLEDMEQRSEELRKEIEQVERDWEGKQDEERVPGAQEPLEEVETERQDIGEQPGGEER